MIVVLNLGLKDWIESERESGSGNCFAHRKVLSHYFILNSKPFFEAHKLSVISPISQRREGSEWVKDLSKVIQLVRIYFQVLNPLLSPLTIVLPIISVISVNRIFTLLFLS